MSVNNECCLWFIPINIYDFSTIYFTNYSIYVDLRPHQTKTLTFILILQSPCSKQLHIEG